MSSREQLPMILIRGFGGLSVDDERRVAYQGFNDGTVYHHKRGENYIYEGMVLRLLKAGWQYHDATNVIGYYATPVAAAGTPAGALAKLSSTLFAGDSVVIDPGMASRLLEDVGDVRRTIWIFRYYDLSRDRFSRYGEALRRLIELIRVLAEVKHQATPLVNIVAHSMGGLIVREAIQWTYPKNNESAERYINKVVTLGTPHKGISFQLLKRWVGLQAGDELEQFNPDFQADAKNQRAAVNFHQYFPRERLLAVVGTNYRTYGPRVASWANRVFSADDEYGPNYNRSDGLVQQAFAQIDGAPRTFVHKCHGGEDSLVTSREAFEISTRFFFGNMRARLYLRAAKVLRGKDLFGRSEYFFGIAIKPRGVDFELFHQSPEAENCYGPFSKQDLSDKKPAFNWAGPKRLIWEGFLDTSRIIEDPAVKEKSIVMRLDVYVGERDLLGLGFSDNVIFRKQYYIRALIAAGGLQLFRHDREDFVVGTAPPPPKDAMTPTANGWEFGIGGTGFAGTLGLEMERL